MSADTTIELAASLHRIGAVRFGDFVLGMTIYVVIVHYLSTLFFVVDNKPWVP